MELAPRFWRARSTLPGIATRRGQKGGHVRVEACIVKPQGGGRGGTEVR
jgi:hypothetical protein